MLRKVLRVLFLLLVLLSGVNTNIFAQDTNSSEPKPLADEDISLTPKSFPRAEADVRGSVLVGTLHIKSKSYNAPITLRIGGLHRSSFSVSPEVLPAGTTEADVKISYDPTSLGTHRASLFIECVEDASASKTLRLEGIAKDPDNPPVVTVTPNTFNTFNTAVGVKTEQTIRVAPNFCPDHVKVSLASGHLFKISTSQVFRFNAQNVVVSFLPLEAGEFNDTLIVSTYGVAEQRIPLHGVASGKHETEKKEGNELVLSTENPLSLLNETFENHERFRTLTIDRWSNVAISGNRAWWGYSFPDYERETPNEGVAYVTGYNSRIEVDEATPAEMLLISPPLDFVNAQQKILTFRLRGDMLRDDQTEKLTVYYIEMENGQPKKYPLGGFTVPASRNESGEWKDFHLDLSEQELPNVFFVAFGYKAENSPLSTVKYYVDDVTWGRNDLPVIRTNTRELHFLAQPNTPTEAQEITVTTANITAPLRVTLGGRNTKGFNVTPKTLPAEGGVLSVRFQSEVEGRHEGFIRLATRGAADQIIELKAANTSTTGIEIVLNETENARVFNLQGHHVLTTNNASVEALKQHLKAGVYVVKTKEQAYKITIP